MRIRFFNTFEPVVPLYRDLLPRLAADGHEAEAVLADRRYRPGESRDGEAPFRLRTVPTLAPGGRGSRWGRLALYASYGLSAAAYSSLSRGVDLNVFLTQPPLFNAWGMVLRRLRGQPYVVVVMDLYPWVGVESGALSPRGLPARLAGRTAQAALRGAQRVVVIGRCAAERVESLGVAPERVVLIRNWADTEVVRPVSPAENRLRKEHGLERELVVMYSGNLGLSHYFDDFLAVAGRLCAREEVVFLVAGGGSRLGEVEAAVRERALPNVRFLGYQPPEELAASLSMGDVHFVSLREGFEGLVVPSKAYGAMAAGRPLIYQGSSRGEIARMVTEEDVGVTVAQGDVGGLEAAILRAVEDRAWRLRAGERARRLAETRYSSAAGLSAYATLFSRLAE